EYEDYLFHDYGTSADAQQLVPGSLYVAYDRYVLRPVVSDGGRGPTTLRLTQRRPLVDRRLLPAHLLA
ncbi:hypothetical protein, partial [Pseudomonas syringae]